MQTPHPLQTCLGAGGGPGVSIRNGAAGVLLGGALSEASLCARKSQGLTERDLPSHTLQVAHLGPRPRCSPAAQGTVPACGFLWAWKQGKGTGNVDTYCPWREASVGFLLPWPSAPPHPLLCFRGPPPR